MKIKTVITSIFFCLLVIGLGFSRVMAATSGMLNIPIPSGEEMMKLMDKFVIEEMGDMPRTVYDSPARTIYVPAERSWANPLPTDPSGTSPFTTGGFRNGLIRPYIQSYLDRISNRNLNSSDSINSDLIDVAIKSLATECRAQCTNITWYGKFQISAAEECSGKDCTPSCPSGYHYCNAGESGGPCCRYSQGELIGLCRDFECGIDTQCGQVDVSANDGDCSADPAHCFIDGDGNARYLNDDGSVTDHPGAITQCNTNPYKESHFKEDSKYLVYTWFRNAIECFEEDADLSIYHPGWCSENVNDKDEKDAFKEPCSDGDREMRCLEVKGAMPKVTGASIVTVSYLSKLLGKVAVGFESGDLGGWLKDEFAEQINAIKKAMNEYFPQFAGGASDWNKVPDEKKSIINITGFCNNYSNGSCSCGDVLPLNGDDLTNEGLQAILAGWGVTSSERYCVNSEGDLACYNGYGWAEDLRDDLAVRNVYASRAAYAGWVDDKLQFHPGGLCGTGGKAKSIGNSEKNERSYTDDEFWAAQARYFEDYYRASYPEMSGQTGKYKGDYGGCDDRSDMLYQRNTSASCQRKKSSAPKCRSGSRRYSSWACDENGGVINQCSKGFANGRNTSCQACGPIYCGSKDLFSDTNTVRRNRADGSLTRHYWTMGSNYRVGAYKSSPVPSGTPVASWVPGSMSVDGSEEFYSHRSIACEGDNCDSKFNDAIFGNNVLPDRTCESVNGPGYIVDPCSQNSSTIVPNNWGGTRYCFSACCKSSDGKTCDYLAAQGAPAGICPETTVDECKNLPAGEDNLGSNICGLQGDVKVDAVRKEISDEAVESICDLAGRQDSRYLDSVGAHYVFTGSSGGLCYLCGCGEIGATDGNSGWWPANALIKPHGTGTCATANGLTVEEQCEDAYNLTDGYANPRRGIEKGYDGIATAKQGTGRYGVSLLKYVGGMSSPAFNCARCRCVRGDGICDGCVADGTDTLGCANFPDGNGKPGLDPDCNGICDKKIIDCNYNSVCEPELGEKYPPCPDCNTCGNGICEPAFGETTLTCPEDCGSGDGVCNRDGQCNGNESCANCPEDCNGEDCPSVTDIFDCPDGYSKLCDGTPSYPGLPTCMRCYDNGEDANEPGVGGCLDDGYCNPLCREKDSDCDPLEGTTPDPSNPDAVIKDCPIGFKPASDTSCTGDGDTKRTEHPLFKSCLACGNLQETCDAGLKNTTCAPGWKPMLKAEQQLLYQNSLCYGYQMYSVRVYNDLAKTELPNWYYDYQQRYAWMNGTKDYIENDFVNSASKGGYRRCRPPRTVAGAGGNCEFVCVPADHQLLVLSCSEIDARYPHEFGKDVPPNGTRHIFLPDVVRSGGNREVFKAGINPTDGSVNRSLDLRCGRYYQTYPLPTINNPNVGAGAGNGGDINGDGDVNAYDDINGDGIVDWRDVDAKASYLYTDWWQAGGSAYGKTGISNYEEDGRHIVNPGAGSSVLNPATGNLVRGSYQYALNNGTCIGSIPVGGDGSHLPPNMSDQVGFGSGMQVTGDNASGTSLQGFRTYRSQTDAAANNLAATYGYTHDVRNARALDFNYYRSKFDYANCGSECEVQGTFVRIIASSNPNNITKLSNLESVITAHGGKKLVFFIEGNFMLDKNLVNNPTAYLAFIVNGQFVVGTEAGYPLMDNNSCEVSGDLCKPALDAVVIAQSFKMDINHSTGGVDTQFNQQGLYCDKRLVLSGAYSFWGGEDIVFTRTLLGCGFKTPPPGEDTLNIHDQPGVGSGLNGEPHRGRDAGLLNKNPVDRYCRTGRAIRPEVPSPGPSRNGNGYYDYYSNTAGVSTGAYNNFNRLYSATQILTNPALINNTPDWMKENSSTRLEVQ